MKHSLMIVSYAPDIQWLRACLKSTAERTTGFEEVVIVVPEREIHEFLKLNLTVEKLATYPAHDFRSGYFAQQWAKCCAEQFCSGEWISHIDSDCVWTAPFDASKTLFDGKAILLITPYASISGVPWQSSTEEALGFPCPYETMRRHPGTYHRTTYPKFRGHFLATRQQDIHEWLVPKRGHSPSDTFSEFNCLGSYALARDRDHYHFIDTTTATFEPIPLTQFWSHARDVFSMVSQGRTNEEINSYIQRVSGNRYPDEAINTLRSSL